MRIEFFQLKVSVSSSIPEQFSELCSQDCATISLDEKKLVENSIILDQQIQTVRRLVLYRPTLPVFMILAAIYLLFQCVPSLQRFPGM
jgi:hypothetical protein